LIGNLEVIVIQLPHTFGWAQIEECIFLAQRSRTTNATMRFRPTNANSGLGKSGRYTQSMRKLVVPVLLFMLSIVATAQGQAVPGEISADLGACSAVITVTGADSKPIYAAKITARVQYGVMAIKRLDLEAYTGADGKLKITRLPESLKKPMIIHVSKDDKGDQIEFKPAQSCHATFDIQLR
jgi:hypothetical protein